MLITRRSHVRFLPRYLTKPRACKGFGLRRPRRQALVLPVVLQRVGKPMGKDSACWTGSRVPCRGHDQIDDRSVGQIDKALAFLDQCGSIANCEQAAQDRRLARPLGADLGLRPMKQARRRLDALRRSERDRRR